MVSVTTRSDRLAAWLIRWRWPLLVVAAALTVSGRFFSPTLNFDQSIESMFAADDPVLADYLDLKAAFAGNEIVLLVYRDPELLDRTGEGISRVNAVARLVAAVDGVKAVVSLSDLNRALADLAIWPNGFPVVDPQHPMAPGLLQVFEGYTHGSQGDIAAIVCMLYPNGETQVPREQTISQLRKLIEQLPEGTLTGEPVLVSDGFEFIKNDGNWLGRVTVLLLAGVILLCFRSVRWVLIPLAVMVVSLWFTRGILAGIGMRLTMVSSMLAALVAVISVATVVHIIIRFREGRARQYSQRQALQWSLGLVIAPVCWACISDAAGFAALMSASVGPVHDFGLMMSLASLIVLLSIFMVVPGLALLGRFDADPRHAWGERRLRHLLENSVQWMQRRRNWIAAALIPSFLLASSGAAFLQVETDFTRNYRSDTQIARAYRFVEENLGGAGALDIVVPAPRVLDEAFLDRVNLLQHELRKLSLVVDGRPRPALTKVISAADLDAAARKNFLLARLSPELRFQGMKMALPTFADALRSTQPDAQGVWYFRILLRADQRLPSEQQRQLIEQVQKLSERHFPATDTQPRPVTTGIYVLLSALVESVLRDQFLTFALAALLVLVAMMIAFRSLGLASIAMIPNLVPILILLGMLGWLGIKINMGAAMIAAVSIGLSIDSSIHYIFSFQRARAAGDSSLAAITSSQQRVGRAATFSTLALIVGFSGLCLSQFVPTVYFGALVGLAMLGGLFGNLVILPLLLLTFCRGGADTASSAAAGPVASSQPPALPSNGPHS